MNVNFIGRLGRDAEKHEGKNGGSFVSFNVAIDEYNPETKQNETIWIRATDGSERTLNMLSYLKKGTMLNIIGNERVSLYNGQNGTVINRDVRVDRWDFVRSGKSDATETTQATETTATTPQQTITTPSATENATTGSFVQPTVHYATTNAEDDLPF